MPYLDAGGVDTFYEEHGRGDPLLLLHGGLAEASSFGQQTPVLAEHYRVILPERRGHGRTADIDGPITYSLMADDTIAFLDTLEAGPAHLVGWSDGGNVGLLVAIRRPDVVRKVVTMGSNRTADGLTPAGKAAFTPDSPSSTIPITRDMWKATAVDPDRFDAVLEKMEHCWFDDYEIPLTDLAHIEAPMLVMVGDDDIPRWEQTLQLYDAIPDAQLAVVPGTSHLAPVEKPELVNRLILDFLAEEGSPATLMPLRRG